LRTLGTIIVIVLCGLPALFAGWPSAAPAWFNDLWQGAPLSIVVMSGLLFAFILLAGFCSAAAKAAGGGDR
jgi:hypothetical protein